jgi:predicted nucleotidyltransferase component of viral defense system
MTRLDPPPIRVHEDAALFQEAVNFTAAETAFATRLIEKDYFCSVLLRYLSMADSALVFKGGTCLAKVHAGFYRLSEDLDFVIPVPAKTTRAVRSQRVAGLKSAIARLERDLPACRVVTPLRGANSSTQYIAVIGYASRVLRQQDTIKVEIALREPLLTPPVDGAAQTLLRDPVSGGPMVPAVSVPCISRIEAMAEKFRAALSRREVAIRDFYDIDYAVRHRDVQPEEPSLIDLVRQKLAVSGNDPLSVSASRLTALQSQLPAQLKPVLRSRDFAAFDLDRAVAIVAAVATRLESA